MIRLALLAICLAGAPLPALAHKVIASVFASGDQIEGEVGLSNGEMAANQTVEVFDGAGTKLGEATTDSDGFFVFTPDQPVKHVFRADLGAGHVAHAEMEAGDVAAIVGAGNPAEPKPVGAGGGRAAAQAATIAFAPSPTVAGATLTDEEQAVIARIVRDEMRPLRKEIMAYKEKNDLQTILGGIGYILGLAGIGFYVAANRKLKGAT